MTLEGKNWGNIVTPDSASAGFEFHASKELGGPWLLDALWNKLGMANAIKGLLEDRQFSTPVERLCFAMVAGRILAPGSKLSLEHWVSKKAYITDLCDVDVHTLYRAMDLLVESNQTLQKQVFTEVAKNARLDVDLIFLDTTNTYFETDEDASDSGLLKRGHRKDGHAGLPLVSIAFAVTRTGIPIRCWVFPGNTSDQTIVEQVKQGVFYKLKIPEKGVRTFFWTVMLQAQDSLGTERGFYHPVSF